MKRNRKPNQPKLELKCEKVGINYHVCLYQDGGYITIAVGKTKSEACRESADVFYRQFGEAIRGYI